MSRAVNRSGSISELLEPAMDGPPSPETLRALSNQMRLASTMEKHQSHHSRQSHQTTSSGSSSLRSLTSVDRPSWDTKTFDNNSTVDLSRKSSGRSTTSTQPRDRHESVQIFGKNIFAKRGKLRRESSAQSSSSSSLYSADIPYDKGFAMTASAGPMLPPPSSHGLPSSSAKEPLIPSFFNRRRTASKSGPPSEDLDGRRRLQISGPFNFQHLTHTQKEQLPDLQHASRVALQSKFVLAQSEVSPTDGSLNGIQAESLHFPNFSSEALPINEETNNLKNVPAVPRRYPVRPHASSVSSVYPPQRTLNHSRSQDQLRVAPPRPPRSPIEASSFSRPIPPPRLSSRASLHPGDMDAMASPPRPRTSGGFRQPPPSFSSLDMPRPPLMHAHSYSADMNVSFTDTRRVSQMPDVFIPPSVGAAASATPDDANWPLAAAPPAASTTAFDILPGVPEEEEHVFNPRSSVRRSRMSVASNASSLRKSHSLPLLQQFPQPQSASAGNANAQRPPSAASDTLGRFDLISVQRSMREAVYVDDADAVDSLAKANWEDDIDYCYEHEIEADCEYAWDRPSMDLSRDDALADVAAVEGSYSGGFGGYSGSFGGRAVLRTAPSPHMLSPHAFDMPALSPASQSSATSMNEAVTPTTLAMRRAAHLTIQTSTTTTGEDTLRPMHKFFHGRSGSRGSRASSFKESHGFNLSPSLFIPGADNYDRFRPPVHGAPVGFAIGADEDDEYPAYVMSMDKSMLFLPARTSASTTASRESRDSVLSNRHISANSTATDLTRLTMSTASIEDLMYKKDQDVPQI